MSAQVSVQASEQSLSAAFERIAAEHPTDIAVVQDQRRVNYRDLNAAANRLAAEMTERDAAPESVVGLLLPRGIEMIAAMLAARKAGFAYLPLDPDDPPARTEAFLKEAGAAFIIAPNGAAIAPELRRWDLLSADRAFDRSGDDPGNLVRLQRPDELAYVMFTSGSTGRPKGVEIEQRSIWNLVLNADYARLGPNRVVLHHSPVSFDASTFEIWGPLLHGGRCAVVTPRCPALADLEQAIHAHGATTAFFTTLLFNTIVDECPQILRGLDESLVGGQSMSAEHVRRAQRALPNLHLTNIYGPTECTTFAASFSIPRPLPESTASVPIGRPIAGTTAFVVDGGGQIVPEGTVGELWLGGAGVARGYRGQRDLTADRFVPDPIDSGARVYRTGDRMRVDAAGNLEFLGRLDDQIKLRGFRIEPGEIEATLRRHPAIADAAVLMRIAPGGAECLVAYYVSRDPEGPSPEDLRAFCGQSLPQYMKPATFVSVEQWPLSAHGKLDRDALPPPDWHNVAVHIDDADAPPVAGRLAQLWSDLLGVAIGVDDNVFERGADSLAAMRIAARVERELGQRLSIETLLACPTARDVAAKIDCDTLETRGQQAETAHRPPAESVSHLSPGEESLWFLSRTNPDSPAYNVPVAFRLEGQLDVGAVRRSVECLVQRHPALRTTFSETDGIVRKRVAAHATVDFSVRRTTATRVGCADRELHDLLAAESARPFDLRTGPLLRTLVVECDDAPSTLQFCMHHIVTDGWSVGVFLREFSECYNAFCRKDTPRFKPVIQDVGCAGASPRPSDVDFWRELLSDAPESLALPCDRGRHETETGRGDVVRFRLARDLADRVVRLARDEHATEFMVLLAAYGALLHRISGQRDLLVGAVSAGRSSVEIEDVLGYFATTLPLRIPFPRGATFRDALRRVRQTAIDALDHASASFKSIVEATGPQRRAGQTPLLQAVFVVQSAPRDSFQLDGLECRPLDVHNGAAKFDLTMAMTPAAGEWAGELEYSRDLFDDATARGICDAFLRMLEAAVDAPDGAVSALPILSEEDCRRVQEWGRPRRTFAVDEPLHALFERRATVAPDSVAAVFGNTSWSYAKLNRRANRIAAALRRKGVAPGDVVTLCTPRSLELLAALLGILKTGAAYLPIESDAPPDRIRQLMADSQSRVVVVDRRAFAEAVCPGVAQVDVCSVDETVSESPPEQASSPTTASDLAYVIYTSGSTGRPKGVEVTHGNVVRLFSAAAEHFDFTPRDVWTCFHSIAFDFSVWEIWGAWLTGGRVVMIPADIARSPTDFFNVVREKGATVLSQTPSAFRGFAEADEASGARVNDLRYVVFGGEELRPSTLRRWVDKYGFDQPQLVNMYGITETTVHVTHHRLTAADLAAPRSPIGRPLADLAAHVLDEDGQIAAIGTPGELYVGGAGVSRGYRNQPETTADRFLDMPQYGGRVYRTGDRVRWTRDGRLEYLGRLDEQLKLRGYRIEPGEIAAQIESLLGDVQVCVDVLGDDAAERRLVAYIAVSEPGAVPPDHVRQSLRSRLPDYMVPSRIVILESLPLTPNGKVDRRALAQLASTAGPRHAPPRTFQEQTLARIWRELLGRESVDVDEDFFAAGGHSLLAVRLVAQIERDTGRRMPLSTLFQARTIEQQAAWLESDAESSPSLAPNLVTIRAGCGGPPVYFMHDIHGGLMYCRELVEQLPRQQQVVGFEPCVAADKHRPCAGMDALASTYVDQILQRQGDGPYHLAGWSFGGMLAYSVACELERRGAELGVVAIIDTSACWYEPITVRGALESVPRFFGNVPPWLATVAADWDSRRVAKRMHRKLRTAWKRVSGFLTERGPMTLAPDFEDVFDDASEQPTDDSFMLARDHFDAFVRYTPTTLMTGSVHVFRASTRPLFYSLAPDLGWRKWARGTLRIEDIPGSHATLLARESAGIVADRLASAIGSWRAGR